jgi:two-component system, cell cycle sensor histidine kinase and response regulator CckA
MSELAAAPARERPELQGELQGALLTQKAELLGELAGAIAHRFNNIMMALSSYAEVELRKATPLQKRSLEQVLGNIGQATSLVQKLLRLSRRRVPSPQPLSLNSVITGMSGLLQQLAGDGTTITLNLSPKSQAIRADCVEMEQLLLSLTVKLRNAMAGSAELTISTDLVELGKEFLEPGEQATPGNHVKVSIGTGNANAAPRSKASISEAHSGSVALEQPEFGLERALVKQAGGVMRICSSEDGTSCAAYFPALQQAALSETDSGVLPRNLAITKTILVVEDDDAVRVPAAEFLKMEGFKVLQAKTGPEALEIVERHQGPLDLLVADVIMPEMSGGQVAEKLLETYPGLKVLYMSGDSENAPALNSPGLAHSVLQKPFRLHRLNETIHDLLGQ